MFLSRQRCLESALRCEMGNRVPLAAVVALVTLAVSVGNVEANGVTWGYDRCGTTGPDDWANVEGFEACAGTENSPIMLCEGETFDSTSGAAPSIDVTKYHTETYGQTVANMGHTIQLTRSGTEEMTVGNLAFRVGRAQSDMVDTWKLHQIHLHWGRGGASDEGSEHVMFGRRYAAELHLVHYNDKYGDFGTAAGNADGLAVIGVMLDKTDDATSESEALKLLAAGAGNFPPPPGKMLGSPLSTAELLPDDLTGYYAYAGGLTTPTCAEHVTWIVLTNPVPVSAGTLQELAMVKNQKGVSLSKDGNWRPIQPLGARTIFKTDGVAKVECQAPPEPVYECGNLEGGIGRVLSILGAVGGGLVVAAGAVVFVRRRGVSGSPYSQFGTGIDLAEVVERKMLSPIERSGRSKNFRGPRISLSRSFQGAPTSGSVMME